MRKRLQVLFIALPIFYLTQQLPSQYGSTDMLNMATPNVANMERFTESAVNYYSGKSNFSVPIFTIKAGSISYPISLNYAAGGIQVNSLASDVGLGWSITDSFVNRTIVGHGDFDTFPNPYSEGNNCEKAQMAHWSKFWLGFFSKTHPTDHFTQDVDYYPDMYKFIVPSINGNFYFENINKAIDLNKTNTKIEWNIVTKKHNYLKSRNVYNSQIIEPVNERQCVTDYDNFTITTKDGIKYYFNDKDVYHNFTTSSAMYDSHGSIAGSFPQTGSWHISKIVDNLTGDEINFTYEEYTSEKTDIIGDIYNGHYLNYEAKSPSKFSPIETSCYLPSSLSESYGYKYYSRGLSIKRLKKINYRYGSIEFSYNENRLDKPNAKALTNIIIRDYNNTIINEYEFKYDYFYSTIQKDEYSKRLKLTSIQEKGKPKYLFDYYEDIQMPNIGSPYQDFFGFCNQVEVNFNPADYSLNRFSKYYYYPNKKEYSILPYNFASESNKFLLNGGINKEPNEYSKTWSLKKVTFPTGGTNTYDIESNTFSIWDNIVKGGGTRIKQQILTPDTNSIPRIINYNYFDSGYLFNVPYVGHPGSKLYSWNDLPNPSLNNLDKTNLQDYFFIYNNSKINYDIVNQFFVGYSKVEENENGIKTIYEYYNKEYPNEQTRSNWTLQGTTYFSSHCLSSFLIWNCALGNEAYVDRSYKRGSLKFMSLYDNLGRLVQKKENIYSSLLETGLDSNGERYFNGANVITLPNTSGDNDYDYAELISTRKSYNALYNNLAYTKTTQYLPSGNIENESYMYYDEFNQNLLQKFNKTKTGTSYPYYRQSILKYPVNYNSVLNEPFMQDLVNINKINNPVINEIYEGEFDLIDENQTYPAQLLSKSKIIFSKDSKTSNKVLPIQKQIANDGYNFYDTAIFDRYDNKGNLLQSTNDGIPTTYIYGYNQNYPIATIVGATYDQVMTAFGKDPNDNQAYLQLDIVNKSILDIDQNTENNLIKELDTFRANSDLANYQITTQTYDPLIGVTSSTPPNGIREVYKYDSNNRLIEVKDINGRILKENKYKYK